MVYNPLGHLLDTSSRLLVSMFEKRALGRNLRILLNSKPKAL